MAYGISVLLHVGLILLIVMGIPWHKKPMVLNPEPITIDIATMGEATHIKRTNKYIKPQKGPSKIMDAPAPQPVPEPEPKPKLKEKPAPQPDPTPLPPAKDTPPPVEEADLPQAVSLKRKPAVTPPKEAPKPKESAQPKPKNTPKEAQQLPQPKPKPVEAPKKKKDSFDDVLKAVADLREKDLDVEQDDTALDKPQPNATDTAAEMTISEIDALRRQLMACWTPPAGIQNPEDIIVELDLTVNPDATVQRVVIVDVSRTQRDSTFRVAAEAAARAVQHPACTPLRLPKGKADLWQSFRLVFNPKDMF